MECRAYSDTYRLLKRIGKCGYAQYQQLLDVVIAVVEGYCDEETAKKVLGDDYKGKKKKKGK